MYAGQAVILPHGAVTLSWIPKEARNDKEAVIVFEYGSCYKQLRLVWKIQFRVQWQPPLNWSQATCKFGLGHFHVELILVKTLSKKERKVAVVRKLLGRGG